MLWYSVAQPVVEIAAEGLSAVLELPILACFEAGTE